MLNKIIEQFIEKYPLLYKPKKFDNREGFVDITEEVKQFISKVFQKYDNEICICAAVIATDGTIIRGHRHSDAITALISRKKQLKKSRDSQGFITSKGRYVNRVEGRKLQEDAKIKSVAKGGYRGDILFSEDLY